MAALSLEHVRKAYRSGAVAVRDVSLEVADGELVSLVGPSGCGKSTTLNLIAGLDELSGGVIRIDGEIVNERSPGERDIAMVFQSYALYPHLDVRRNIAFPLEVAGLGKKVIEQRVDETAELLGIRELLARRPRELSGGQRQRVALGRALVRRPKIFLFDEPLSNLDAELRLQMRGELKRLHERLRATFIYVTHDQAEAMTLSDRVVVMNKGEVQQVGAPGELYERPGNVFVARFFGTPRINLIRPETAGIDARHLLLGVRAEDVEIGLGEAPAGALACPVDLIEPMGSESWLTVRIGDEALVARARPTLPARVGELAWIRLDHARLHWFDATSGRRVEPPR